MALHVSLGVAVADVAAADAATGSGPNAAAEIVYAAVAGQRHVISGVIWSYTGGDPTTGTIQLLDGATVVREWDVTAAGTGPLAFTPALGGTVGASLTLRLTAGGSGITGKINALAHWLM